MEYEYWWLWIVFGSLLLIADIFFVNVYFLVWFGCAAILVGIGLTLFPETSLWVQITEFGVLSAVLLLLWLYFIRPAKSRALLEKAQTQLPGQSGIVIGFANGKGRLRLQRPIGGKDVWEFVSTASFRPGDPATIEKVDREADSISIVATPPAPQS
jgi:membrane protein implicated in regulation of membrane protease activity